MNPSPSNTPNGTKSQPSTGDDGTGPARGGNEADEEALDEARNDPGARRPAGMFVGVIRPRRLDRMGVVAPTDRDGVQCPVTGLTIGHDGLRLSGVPDGGRP